MVPANGVAGADADRAAARATFAVGDPVEVTATAVDPEDGPCPSVERRPGPLQRRLLPRPPRRPSSPTLSRPFDDHGDATRLEIVATATDQYGVEPALFVAQPRLRTLTLTGSPPSAVTVNGTAGPVRRSPWVPASR